MRMLMQLVMWQRSRRLARQFSVIENRIGALAGPARARLAALTLREIGHAAGSPFPHLHGTPPGERYVLWGHGTEIGFGRAGSNNPEVALRGIALWLAAAYHETKDSPQRNLLAQHRSLFRLVRDLKDAPGSGDVTESWMQTSAAA